MPKYTLILDSSQISTFLECPRLWYYTYQKRLIPSGLAQAPPKDKDPRDIGTYGHRILDLFYKLRFKMSYNEAAAQALQYDPDIDTCECGCLVDEHRSIPQLNLTECQKCHKCLKQGGIPSSLVFKLFPLNLDSRMKVRERLKLYWAYWQNNDFQPLSARHVEVGFAEPIYEDSENLFVLEGRIDMIATLQGLNCIVDHKFQVSMHELYTKSIQFKNYALVNKSIMMIINYVRLAQNVVKDITFKRTLINFSVPELLDWKQKLIRIFFTIKRAQETENFSQNWSACSGKFNYACNFTPLCEEFTPQMVAIKEKQLYTIKEQIWRPW